MSARSPAAMRLESTLVSTICPTARMSAVVSVRITRTTIVMEMMAAMLKVGRPRWKGMGSSKMAPWPTEEKSALPMTIAATVPTIMASRIESRDIVLLPSLLNSSTTARVNAASMMLETLP